MKVVTRGAEHGFNVCPQIPFGLRDIVKIFYRAIGPVLDLIGVTNEN